MPTVLPNQPIPSPKTLFCFLYCCCRLQQGQGHYTKCKQGDASAGKHTEKQDEERGRVDGWIFYPFYAPFFLGKCL